MLDHTLRNLGLALLVAGTAVSAHAAPSDAGGKALSQLLPPFEQNTTVISAERERSQWEIVACERRGRCHEIYVHPVTGKELRRTPEFTMTRLPPADAKPLSTTIAALEQRKLGEITDVEFDDGLWEVDVRTADGRSIELYIDPMTAAIRRCEGRSCPAQ